MNKRVRKLGRHVQHDPRSRAYSAGTAAVATVMHRTYGPPLDQGDVGACTGFAMAAALNTRPHAANVAGRLRNPEAMRLYSLATKLDEFAGVYPPDDTGSSGLGVAKAAKSLRLITGYGWTFSLEQLLGSLTLAPGIAGVSWYDSFDSPKANGQCPLSPNAGIRGGHEVALVGVDVARKRVWCLNSWGRWGYRGTGRFWFSWDTLGYLLSQYGDATFPRTAL